MQTTSRLKLVVVGDCTGKTCLLRAFMDQEFEYTYPTVFDTYITEIKVDNQIIQFDLYDTAGGTDYDRLRPKSYQNTDVIVACFSIDNRDSFANILHRWMPEVRHFCPRTPVVLAATMIDLRQDPTVAARTGPKSVVSANEGAELGRQIKAVEYVECSAKTRDGVQEVFTAAARAALCPSCPSQQSGFRCVFL